MSETVKCSEDKLNDEQGGVGVGVGLASIIEIAGLGLVFFLIGPRAGSAGWQLDCYRIGLIVIGSGSVVLWITTLLVIGGHVRLVFAEWLVRIIYFANTIALSVAMARAGGLSSVLGHIIPLQLSGILLVEQQKEKVIAQNRFVPAIYGLLTLVIWWLAVSYRQRIAAWSFWTGPTECVDNCNDDVLTVWLLGFEIVFTAVAYYLAKSEDFHKLFKPKGNG
jgi:hypothetical protein